MVLKGVKTTSQHSLIFDKTNDPSHFESQLKLAPQAFKEKMQGLLDKQRVIEERLQHEVEAKWREMTPTLEDIESKLKALGKPSDYMLTTDEMESLQKELTRGQAIRNNNLEKDLNEIADNYWGIRALAPNPGQTKTVAEQAYIDERKTLESEIANRAAILKDEMERTWEAIVPTQEQVADEIEKLVKAGHPNGLKSYQLEALKRKIAYQRAGDANPEVRGELENYRQQIQELTAQAFDRRA